MSEFGGLIRDAREKLGMSPHRVAELIGRASGTVRAWERGRTVPSDPVVVSSLAAVLAIKEETLFRAANLNPPDRHQPLTIEQELATIAPSRPAAPTPTSERPAIVADVPEPAPPPEAVGDPNESASPVSSPSEFFQKGIDSLAEAGAPLIEKLRTRRESLLEKLRERRRRAPRPTPAPVGRTPVPTAAPVAPTGSYMDDPDERWSYRLRAVWTAAGVAGLGVLLLWAGSRALDAFGDTWDALLAGL
ncbi:MAG: helix-turn-helix transcriptional regulator [Acidimicrobiia bacterium]